jgi:predicted secreted Zn-dependent protease
MVIMAIALLALGGCKVKITVPEGGSVVSSTGLYGCTSGEICTIDVDHPYLAESFTATPDAGYEFAGWEKKHGGFCGGKKSACNLSTTGFPLNPALNTLLGKSDVFTMNPVFVYSGTEIIPTPTEGKWTLKSNHSTINYEVYGNSASELLSAMQGPQNPMVIQPETGKKGQGGAGYVYRIRYWYITASNQEYCKIVKAEFEIEMTTILPQLSPESGYSKTRWGNYHEGLTAHEAGHQELNRRLVTDIPNEIDKVGRALCDNLERRVWNVSKAAKSKIDQLSHDYDVRTNHGGYTIPYL